MVALRLPGPRSTTCAPFPDLGKGQCTESSNCLLRNTPLLLELSVAFLLHLFVYFLALMHHGAAPPDLQNVANGHHTPRSKCSFCLLMPYTSYSPVWAGETAAVKPSTGGTLEHFHALVASKLQLIPVACLCRLDRYLHVRESHSTV